MLSGFIGYQLAQPYKIAPGLGIAIHEWRAATAAPAPAADARLQAFQGAAVKQVAVDGRGMPFSEGRLSGQKVYALYRNANEVNYAIVSGSAPTVLRKVAASLR